ncbi:MAG: ATP-dependent DNA ligase [Thermoleophilia bacterium]|nr:ATP-dependent DNA ligase [Thermoleophilia bacterium]MDH3724691.1 ATP-dependent DNA ligase [Thermoleophilia bacterium]
MRAGAGLTPPLPPQLARPRTTLPVGAEWAYEPKLDGFRVIAFADDDAVDLRSRNDKPLSRYFPEIALPAGRYVLDAEIIIRRKEGEDFNALQQRIHPAQSRIALLSKQTPAHVVAFDLLALDGEALLEVPFADRRRLLEQHFAGEVELTPLTDDPAVAGEWLETREGVIAKERHAPYLLGKRKGMAKIKRRRTMDCVVLGWRPGKRAGTLGSLILGAYTADGRLRPVGHCSGFRKEQKQELPAFLARYESGERGSAEPSRWDADRELEWTSLRPELVVEVSYDHASDGRIRHGARFERWRHDRDPRSCGTDQLDS